MEIVSDEEEDRESEYSSDASQVYVNFYLQQNISVSNRATKTF